LAALDWLAFEIAEFMLKEQARIPLAGFRLNLCVN
jgi:hypothetical protein